MSQRVALVILTLNAGVTALGVVEALRSHRLQPHVWLVLDSGSSDSTVEAFAQAGADVVLVDGAGFDHGATRPMAVDRLDGVEAECYWCRSSRCLSRSHRQDRGDSLCSQVNMSLRDVKWFQGPAALRVPKAATCHTGSSSWSCSSGSSGPSQSSPQTLYQDNLLGGRAICGLLRVVQ